jgi:hypothetical protein
MNKNAVYTILGIVIVFLLIGVVTFLKKPITPEIPSIAPKPEILTPIENATQTPVTEEKKETEDTKRFSSCVVLDEEYCDKAKPTYYPNNESIPPEIRGKLAGVKLNLNKGSKIYAPFDGIVNSGYSVSPDGKNYELIFVTMSPAKIEEAITVIFLNAKIDPKIDQEIRTESERKTVIQESPVPILGIKVKKGELIGTIKDENLKLPEEEYNFAITFQKRSETSIESVPQSIPEIVKKYFSVE